MTGYNERLKKEIARRDLALASIKHNASASARILSDRADQWMASVNPAKLIREYPFTATLGAALAGILVAPLLKSHFSTQSPASTSAKTVDGESANGSGMHSTLKFITDALLANLPSLTIALFEYYQVSAKTKSAPLGDRN